MIHQEARTNRAWWVCKLEKMYDRMGVSKNRGGHPKSSILTGFSIINHPFWGTIIFGNTHMNVWSLCLFWEMCRKYRCLNSSISWANCGVEKSLHTPILAFSCLTLKFVPFKEVPLYWNDRMVYNCVLSIIAYKQQACPSCNLAGTSPNGASAVSWQEQICEGIHFPQTSAVHFTSVWLFYIL